MTLSPDLNESVSIEPMRHTDMEAVARIDKRCFPSPWQPTSYLTELSNRAACYLVARRAGEVIAYAGAWVIMLEGHITTLAVDPAHQGRKIGERLLIALLEEAMLRGASHVTLEVREGNRAAQRLYCKYGFRNVAIRKNYYTDNGENALVMWAEEINTRDYALRLRQWRDQVYEACHRLEP